MAHRVAVLGHITHLVEVAEQLAEDQTELRTVAALVGQVLVILLCLEHLVAEVAAAKTAEEHKTDQH